MSDPTSNSFLLRHEFGIRRLHSLTGIIPLGAYMVVHLATNASLLNGPATFQRAVYSIHSFGVLLPLIEWVFILLPLLFHGLLGVWIVRTGRSNSSVYTYANNRRYTWQRWTGLIALVFLLVHVFHLQGWFHMSIWLDYVAHPLRMANFRPYNAASSMAQAMDGVFWPAFYLLGVLACVYHLANGLWTAGITWGIWVSPAAQKRATRLCVIIGVLLAVLGLSAWWAAVSVDVDEARRIEDRMYIMGVESGTVMELEEKRLQPESPEAQAWRARMRQIMADPDAETTTGEAADSGETSGSDQ